MRGHWSLSQGQVRRIKDIRYIGEQREPLALQYYNTKVEGDALLFIEEGIRPERRLRGSHLLAAVIPFRHENHRVLLERESPVHAFRYELAERSQLMSLQPELRGVQEYAEVTGPSTHLLER